jgi:quercetin dioxygenase-like cupin family protein
MTMTHTPIDRLTLVDVATAATLPSAPLEDFDRVTYRPLWRAGKSVAGIMHVPPGAEVTRHRHSFSEHHMWVIDGTGEVLGRPAGPGTYLHVPAGVEHGIDHVGPDGCTVLCLYLRDEAATAAAAAVPAPVRQDVDLYPAGDPLRSVIVAARRQGGRR